MESSADHLSALPLVATATKNARSGDAWVTIVPLVMLFPPLTYDYVKLNFPFSLFLVSRHADNRDKPFTNAASGIVNDNRT